MIFKDGLRVGFNHLTFMAVAGEVKLIGFKGRAHFQQGDKKWAPRFLPALTKGIEREVRRLQASSIF
jgi:hypothetical protein